MRIAIVQAGLGAGGTERVVSLLANERCRKSDEVHVFAFTRANEESYFRFHPDVVVHRLEENEDNWLLKIGLLRGLRRMIMLRAAFRRLRPDLVVSFLTKINVLSIVATRGLHIPVVVSERNNPEIQEKHWLWRFASGIALNWADALVMQTLAITKKLPIRLQEKAVVIANPCERFGEAEPRLESRRIVAVGRLVGQKGFDVLLEAFARTAPQYPQWSLTIFGDGSDRASLQGRISSLRLEGRVTMPGITESAGAWIDGASIFVLSSRYEGFPNVLVEAMAAGLPVVSSDCDFGPGEIVEDGVSGLLIPVGDADRLSGAMARLMGDGALRREMGAAAREAMSRFSAEVVMAKWDACFDAVLARRARASTVEQVAS